MIQFDNFATVQEIDSITVTTASTARGVRQGLFSPRISQSNAMHTEEDKDAGSLKETISKIHQNKLSSTPKLKQPAGMSAAFTSNSE